MTCEQIKILTPRQALNKAYLKEKILRSEIDLFKENLYTLFASIDHEESEENVKTLLRDFLNGTYYKNKHFINTLRDVDLVIYLENNQNKAAVLTEVKRPKNKLEMITKENLNAKAMHELILYYLEERIDHKNNEIKYLIATNVYEWFIFDATLFEHLFYNNKKLVKDYEHWRDKQKTSGNTDFFYDEIAKPLLDELDSEISFVYFNLENYKSLFEQNEKENEKKLIALYKILSPVHLLKQSFANDSNSLDRNFYNELLHILGLEETKEKNKKIITRKPEKERDPGSIIENAILILETENTIARIKQPEKYGETIDDQLYSLALELSITWVNRILFLKLLEAQLYKYHNDDKHKFLNKNFINDFDELYKLFHQVLAVPHGKRTDFINKKFWFIPYLNSSLFEIGELESDTIKINSLDDNTPIELYKNTTLKDRNGKKRHENLPAMYYLFEFLDAYDFTSEGNEEIREDKKTLINASVLGLIFEKINGYKDGSFFTPGFITMYMCRETLQRAVVQKFNDIYRWKCKTLADVRNHIADRRNTIDILEFNAVINSLKIVDPAVGSGHFLVSALNELIAIKSELGLLADKAGLVLMDYEARVENDELIITCNSGEDIFEYHAPRKPNFSESGIYDSSKMIFVREVQRVQETLFREKQTIIENCLFGVDINANSVKIARLRLWIELLKNAYYTEESDFSKLETLPNIDINIKEGNSLINRFPLNADLKSALKTIRYTIEDYKTFVRNYKNTNDKNEKNNFRRFIEDIKSNFRTEIGNNDPRKKKLSSMVFELHNKYQTERLIDVELSKKDKEKLKHEEKKLEEAIKKLKEELDGEAGNVIYNNAFEWRFEFPEALDDEGNFVGFDVVIGNPPYIVAIQSKQGKGIIDYYNKNYSTAEYNPNTYGLFTELGVGKILKPAGHLGFIIPNSWLNGQYFSKLRDYVSQNNTIELVNLKDKAFDVIVETVVLIVQKTNKPTAPELKEYLGDNIFQRIDKPMNWGINPFEKSIETFIERIINGEKQIKDHCFVYRGVETKDNSQWLSTTRPTAEWKPILLGKDVHKFVYRHSGTYVKFIPKELKSNANVDYYNQSKILMRRTGNTIIACSDYHHFIALKNLYLLVPSNKKMLPLILIQLNSKLFSFIHNSLTSGVSKAFAQFPAHYIETLPCKLEENFLLKAKSLVDKILFAKKKNPEADTSALETEIDKLVYQLYGLTEEEIKIVEGK
ncbi:MAG: TaqI-like C-terminal specificity domain-containing protein [Ignavibacteria bacterium]|nr:TaqI-like C-terminal specificity domain-containing protein [Ignavibacteria bacterium]